jgi:hypothetical protein
MEIEAVKQHFLIKAIDDGWQVSKCTTVPNAYVLSTDNTSYKTISVRALLEKYAPASGEVAHPLVRASPV